MLRMHALAMLLPSPLALCNTSLPSVCVCARSLARSFSLSFSLVFALLRALSRSRARALLRVRALYVRGRARVGPRMSARAGAGWRRATRP